MSSASDSRDADSSTFEQNRSAFLIVVGSISAIFITTFSFVLSGPLRTILFGGSVLVGVVSVFLVLVLDNLGQFDENTTSVASENEIVERDVTVSDRSPRTPRTSLAPLVNFDDELIELKAHFGGDFPDQMETFIRNYEKFKSSEYRKRQTVASDMRSSLSPATVLVEEGSEAEEIVSDIGDRLLRYVDSSPMELIAISDVSLLKDGEKKSLSDLKSEQARITSMLYNEGETSTVEVLILFRDSDGAIIRRDYCSVGVLVANERKELDTQLHIPNIASSVDVSVVEATPERTAMGT